MTKRPLRTWGNRCNLHGTLRGISLNIRRSLLDLRGTVDICLESSMMLCIGSAIWVLFVFIFSNRIDINVYVFIVYMLGELLLTHGRFATSLLGSSKSLNNRQTVNSYEIAMHDGDTLHWIFHAVSREENENLLSISSEVSIRREWREE